METNEFAVGLDIGTTKIVAIVGRKKCPWKNRNNGRRTK